MDTKTNRIRREAVLGAMILAIAVVAGSFFSPLFFSGNRSTAFADAISAQAATATPTLTPTAEQESSNVSLALSSDTQRTGWLTNKETSPHWGDPNLYAGMFQDQVYTSIVQFDIGGPMPPGSQVESAALELTGKSADRLGNTGAWTIELVDSGLAQDWSNASADQILGAPALATIGAPLAASDLGAGIVNRFELNAAQTKLVQEQLEFGRITFRVTGPAEGGDNLFAWDSGAGLSGGPTSPQLYLTGVPGPRTIITNTPTPANVLTAAAYVLRTTRQAQEFGTATPFGLGVVTATPGGERVEVTPVDPPENAATAAAIRDIATAVALTTGTYTPTPNNWFVVTRTFTPVPPPSLTPTATASFIDAARLTPEPTSTAVVTVKYLTLPIPSFLKGKILTYSNRLGAQWSGYPTVLNPDGSVVGVLTGDLYYLAAMARENYSPDRQKLAYVAYGESNDDHLQIWMQDLNTGTRTQLTNLSRGAAYDPVWSPDGRQIAYVVNLTGLGDIYVYDLASRESKQLTFTSTTGVYNQHPSWSPDGKQILFKSNRDSAPFQLWIMNADGSDQRNFSENEFEEKDPVWVKP